MRFIYDCCQHCAYMCQSGHEDPCIWAACKDGKEQVIVP